ncbi:helix-turn-helix transcriptional regulator [Ralstonia insidiosa]
MTERGQGMQATASKTLINRKKLLAMIPLSERTIFNMEQRGEFPRRIALTSRNVAWDLAEVEGWIEARKSSGTQAMRPGFTPSAVAGGSAAPFSG